MSKRGENIYKRKDGRWEGRYIISYEQNRPKFGYIYGKTYNETKCKLNEAKSAQQNKNNNITYKSLLTDWLNVSKPKIKESTYSRYQHLISTHIENHFGKYFVSMITTHMMESYVNDLLFEGRLDGKGGLSPKTVSDILSIIKNSFCYAEISGYQTNCNFKYISVKKKHFEIEVLDKKEQNTLIQFLLNKTDLNKMGIILSLYTGIRLGELCALKWQNICFDSNIIRIRYTMQRIQNNDVQSAQKTKIIITEPKSPSSIRDIPIPKCIIEIVRRFQSNPGDFILTGSNWEFVEPRTMQNRFKKILAESGIGDKNFHILRHTFATRCVEQGFETKSLSEILGHSNVNITLNRYVHSSIQLKRDNMDKLEL